MPRAVISHSKSDGIVAGASNTGGVCNTNYATPAANITLDDIAGDEIRAGAYP